MALNSLLVAGYQCYLDGSSLIHKTRETLAPILAAELFSAMLTLVAVYAAVRLGTFGIALFGLVLVVLQYLIAQRTAIRSTTKTSVSSGPITPPAPRLP